MTEEKRKSITTATLQKIKIFLEKQKSPIYKKEIIEKIKVNAYSLDFALKMLEAKKDKEGRVYMEDKCTDSQ
jgi:hypothetical protein